MRHIRFVHVFCRRGMVSVARAPMRRVARVLQLEPRARPVVGLECWALDAEVPSGESVWGLLQAAQAGRGRGFESGKIQKVKRWVKTWMHEVGSNLHNSLHKRFKRSEVAQLFSGTVLSLFVWSVPLIIVPLIMNLKEGALSYQECLTCVCVFFFRGPPNMVGVRLFSVKPTPNPSKQDRPTAGLNPSLRTVGPSNAKRPPAWYRSRCWRRAVQEGVLWVFMFILIIKNTYYVYMYIKPATQTHFGLAALDTC